MKTLQSLIAVVVALAFLSGASMAENKYVGAKKCQACHKVATMGGLAYTVWEKSAHAKAFETLKGKEAEEFAKKKGLTKPASESPECLKCHVTGGGAAANVESTFKKEEGVTCEACHGAASAFLPVHNKDKEKAKTLGLIIPDKTGKACETCHNAESPTFKGFKYAEMWAKIQHSGAVKK